MNVCMPNSPPSDRIIADDNNMTNRKWLFCVNIKKLTVIQLKIMFIDTIMHPIKALNKKHQKSL